MSLKSVLRGERRAFRLTLLGEGGRLTTGTLDVHLFPVGKNAVSREDPMELVGQNLKFCLVIVGANNIPSQFQRHTFVKLSLLFDQDDRCFTTRTAEDTTAPRWGLVKQFELLQLSREVIKHFSTHHLFSFEVFGFST
ncbi:putative kinesin [Leptomonas seymouri]|uniref:Putative kinesin n=1 Tax=Leptomonas seymouri TaxID=5684 RepID=A0A0N0P2Z0_LEPSE|nr:putative kinesin [Leptomonas seymouri]|eukprot:KPI83519.1 putative kinesin [Leptomonas seymouri]